MEPSAAVLTLKTRLLPTAFLFFGRPQALTHHFLERLHFFFHCSHLLRILWTALKTL